MPADDGERRDPGGARRGGSRERPEAGGPSSERRRFLHRLTVGLSATVGGLLALPWITFLLSPVRREDPFAWRRVGALSDFPVGRTVKVTYREAATLPWAGFAAESAAWVRRESERSIVAFTSYCTHVGCPVRWREGARLFLCPCHGGAFYEDGAVAAGPPPRPLDRFPTRIRDGFVEIQALGVPRPRGAPAG